MAGFNSQRHRPGGYEGRKGKIMLNTYGLKMDGLKEAARATKGLGGYHSGEYIQLNYNPTTGEIFTNYLYNLGQKSWVDYPNCDVITICNIYRPTSAQKIANIIKDFFAE